MDGNGSLSRPKHTELQRRKNKKNKKYTVQFKQQYSKRTCYLRRSRHNTQAIQLTTSPTNMKQQRQLAPILIRNR